jgi:hypothetical protein
VDDEGLEVGGRMFHIDVRYICRECGYRWRDIVSHIRMIELPLIVAPECDGCYEERMEKEEE